MRKTVILIFYLLATFSVNAESPDALVEIYFHAISGGDFSKVGKNMNPHKMKDLKSLMDRVIQGELQQGRSQMQRRLFGKEISMATARATTADEYLDRLGSDILNAASGQNFSVDGHTVLGQVAEGNDKVHMVARVEMSQNGQSTMDIVVYSFTRIDGTWYMEFPQTIRQMLAVIEAGARR
jgi:hypothetical protein